MNCVTPIQGPMPPPCDRAMVVLASKGIGLVIGRDAEDEPRDWLIVSGGDARRLARALEEAAALLAEQLVPT